MPPGRWVVWGPDSARRYVWPGAELVAVNQSPTMCFGQRGLVRMPRARFVIVPHVVRPLARSGRVAVMLHDLIPVSASPRPRRWLWWAYFWLSTRTADRVLVYSSATAAEAERVLKLSSDRMRHVELPLDPAFVREISDRRALRPPDQVLLYVGQFKPHKNLERAMRAFAVSRFRERGGRFHLVGGLGLQVEDLRRVAHSLGIADAVHVEPRCSEAELIDRYSTARAVCQPSMQEGLGLGVVEALAAGLPVCCSDIPPHREGGEPSAVFFDPVSVEGIAAAIDEVTDARFTAAVISRPIPADFARSVLRQCGIDVA